MFCIALIAAFFFLMHVCIKIRDGALLCALLELAFIFVGSCVVARLNIQYVVRRICDLPMALCAYMVGEDIPGDIPLDFETNVEISLPEVRPRPILFNAGPSLGPSYAAAQENSSIRYSALKDLKLLSASFLEGEPKHMHRHSMDRFMPKSFPPFSSSFISNSTSPAWAVVSCQNFSLLSHSPMCASGVAHKAYYPISTSPTPRAPENALVAGNALDTHNTIFTSPHLSSNLSSSSKNNRQTALSAHRFGIVERTPTRFRSAQAQRRPIRTPLNVLPQQIDTTPATPTASPRPGTVFASHWRTPKSSVDTPQLTPPLTLDSSFTTSTSFLTRSPFCRYPAIVQLALTPRA
ncbi:unnamed protein product [Rhizoctonia solani]|uniref:Uncharacterized protein n=1 Tax=Rhizoctonia solani TaxID=456999 RepID=A0A8H3GXG1_9AGAM|nr:unnamed protein product [Rhizoctonia solani]